MSVTSNFVNRRRVDFADEAERATYDAKNLIEIANKTLSNPTPTVQDVLDLATRQIPQEGTDHLDTQEYMALLKIEIAVQIKRTAPILNVAAEVNTKATETAIVTNEKGVSLEAITNFVSGLKLKFGVTKEKVLERLQAALTREKLNYLIYFQNNGHQLDVTGITTAGELEFDTCSIDSPKGNHRDKTYYQALCLAIANGATLMTKEKYYLLKSKGIIFDPNSWSWLFSPKAGTPEETGLVYNSLEGGVYKSVFPNAHDTYGGFRVSLTV